MTAPFDGRPVDPIAVLRQWFDAAVANGVREPGAVALATAENGRASNRTVQTVRISELGPVFTSHADSRKGREIEATGWASAVYYWREHGRQVVLAGGVIRLPDEECDRLWHARPADALPMSVLARQGEPLDDEDILREQARLLADSNGRLSRPDGWVGYELRAEEVEFWQASPDRLHRRLRFDRVGAGWTSRRLQP